MAGRLLTHESVHHFGITDEAFADSVAIAIYTATDQKTCPDSTNDPFDSLSCTGDPAELNQLAKYFGPSQSRAVLSNFTVATRQRRCHAMTGCSIWSKTLLEASGVVIENGDNSPYTIGVNQAGAVNLNLGKNNIYIDLDFGSTTQCNDRFNGSLRSPCRLVKGPFKLNPILGVVKEHSNSLDTNPNKSYYNWSPLAPGLGGAMSGRLNFDFDQATFTDHCLRIYNSSVKGTIDPNGFWFEREGVIYSKY